MRITDNIAHLVDHGGRTILFQYPRPVGERCVVRREAFHTPAHMLAEVPLDLGKSPDLHRLKIKLQDEKRIPERRRIPPDVGSTEQLVETVFEVYIVVVREHRADHRLAKPLRAQEYGSPHPFKVADVRRVVHEKAFADKLGPVYDAVWYVSFLFHGMHCLLPFDSSMPPPCKSLVQQPILQDPLFQFNFLQY